MGLVGWRSSHCNNRKVYNNVGEFKNDVPHSSLELGASQDLFFLCSSQYEMQMKTGTAIIVIEDIFRTALSFLFNFVLFDLIKNHCIPKYINKEMLFWNY